MAGKDYSNDIKVGELLDEESSEKQQESADGKSYFPEEDSDSDSEVELDTDSEYKGCLGIDRKRLKDERLGRNTEVGKTEDLFQVLQSVLAKDEEETNTVKFREEKNWDFPEDPENWREEDLQELWTDAPKDMTKPGWDPVCADEDDWEVLRDEVEDGRTPLIAPFYVPYRTPYPPIPYKNYHFDIRSPKSVVEELDRIEEFLRWVSYIFYDGSSYEGTVWDVYVAQNGLVREVKTRKRTGLRSMSERSSCSSVASNQDWRNLKSRFDGWLQAAPKRDMDRILSLQMPLYDFDLFRV